MRVGIEVDEKGWGIITRWQHLACTRLPTCVAHAEALESYDSLLAPDQQRVREMLKASGRHDRYERYERYVCCHMGYVPLHGLHALHALHASYALPRPPCALIRSWCDPLHLGDRRARPPA